MNQPRPLKLYLWKKEDRSARTVKTPKENLRIGGGGGEESASEPGLCNGNHMVAAAQTLPGCLEKLLSSLTPFKKQEENISSV